LQETILARKIKILGRLRRTGEDVTSQTAMENKQTTPTAVDEVSNSSPILYAGNCPQVNSIAKISLSKGAPKNSIIPWQGRLPKPRISPPKTLGDAVMKNCVECVRGEQLVLKLFKMALASTIETLIISPITPTSKSCNSEEISWPALPTFNGQSPTHNPWQSSKEKEIRSDIIRPLNVNLKNQDTLKVRNQEL
jgi:hypothetical protein